ncbi:MAG: zinc-ribbon domain-containing protein [Polyangiaceae bacterium]
MKITCGSCAAKYTVSDDKVQGKTVKVKCRKCGAVIVVSSTGEVQTTGGGSAAASSGGGATYTVSVSDTDQRNMSMSEVIQAYNEGIIDAETYVWAEGMDDWLPLKDVDSIVDALHDAASHTAPAADLGSTVAMDTSSPAADFGSTVAMSSPYDQPSAPAPAMPAGGGLAASSGGGDTTGGFFGSMGTSSSGGGGGGGGGGLATASPGEENSAIFSLGMLTSKVEEKSPNGSGTTEDSGLIDLKALAAGMGGEEEPAAGGIVAAAPSDGGLFPLGAPPVAPVAASTSIPAPAAPATGNRGMVMVLGGAVLVLAAALVFILVRDGGEPPPTATPTATPTPAETPPPAPTEVAAAPTAEPTATAVASADAAPSASASATAKVAANPVPFRPQPGGAGKTPPTSVPKPTPKPTPKPSKGGCGCAADDLMCQMRCSTK